MAVRFAVKVTASDNYPAKPVFAEHWSTAYGKYSIRRRPLAAKVEECSANRGERGEVAAPGWARVPSIDVALTQEISKHEQPVVLATLAREKIACYGDSVINFGIEGNEKADRLANAALDSDTVELDIGLEISDEFSAIDRFVLEKLAERMG